MEHVLHAKKRISGSKSDLKNIRRAGEIPAVIYGNDAKALTVSVNAREFHKSFAKISESAIIHLTIADNEAANKTASETKDVLIKDYQHNAIHDEIMHLDFYEIHRGKLLKTMVPIELEGSPEGVKFGGVIETFLNEVEVETLPKNLPEHISLDISTLAVGESLHVSDLTVLEGVKFINASDQVIVHIGISRKEAALASEEDEEAGEDAVEGENKET